MNHEWCLEVSSGFKDGDGVKRMREHEVKIRKIDRHKIKTL